MRKVDDPKLEYIEKHLKLVEISIKRARSKSNSASELINLYAKQKVLQEIKDILLDRQIVDNLKSPDPEYLLLKQNLAAANAAVTRISKHKPLDYMKWLNAKKRVTLYYSLLSKYVLQSGQTMLEGYDETGDNQ